MRMTKCRCINPTFRVEYWEVDSYTVKDNISGITFVMCPRCYQRIKRLAGYQVLAYPRGAPEVRREVKKFSSTPF